MIKSINYSMKDETDAWKVYRKELQKMKEKGLMKANQEKIITDIKEEESKNSV